VDLNVEKLKKSLDNDHLVQPDLAKLKGKKLKDAIDHVIEDYNKGESDSLENDDSDKEKNKAQACKPSQQGVP
jgi:hypothetical protein